MRSAFAFLLSCFVLIATDALAGRGGGGVHSNHQRELQQFNEQTERDRAGTPTPAPQQMENSVIDDDSDEDMDKEDERESTKQESDLEEKVEE